MSMTRVFEIVVGPLRSRKVRVALATVVAAYAAEVGLHVSEELVFTILGVGAALILGIAHEDNGRTSATFPHALPEPGEETGAFQGVEKTRNRGLDGTAPDA